MWTLGSHQERCTRKLTSDTRPGTYSRSERIAWMLLFPELERCTVSTYAERVSRTRQRAVHCAANDKRCRQWHLHRGTRFILDRSAALQLPVRRNGVLRDQGWPDHRYVKRCCLPGQHSGVLEQLCESLR